MKTRQKPRDQLAFTRGGRGAGLILPDGPVQKMALPRGITTDEARKNWREFWASDIARAVDKRIDRQVVLHWIRSVEERELLRQEVERDGAMLATPRGSVLHPLFGRMQHLDREINSCRVHLGLSPLARFRLLGTVGKAKEAAGKGWTPNGEADREPGPAPAANDVPGGDAPVQEF